VGPSGRDGLEMGATQKKNCMKGQFMGGISGKGGSKDLRIKKQKKSRMEKKERMERKKKRRSKLPVKRELGEANEKDSARRHKPKALLGERRPRGSKKDAEPRSQPNKKKYNRTYDQGHQGDRENAMGNKGGENIKSCRNGEPQGVKRP